MPHSFGTTWLTMTPEKKASLSAYILKQRQKKKEEEEQDEALRNERKRLAEKKLRDQHTLEEVNTQIAQLEKKLSEYKQEKHDLFAQLKKVLHQEDEQRKRIQQIQQQHAKDASEILAKVGPVAPLLPLLGAGSPRDEISSTSQHQAVHSQSQLMQTATSGIQQVSLTSTNTCMSPSSASTTASLASMKRQRSPSPSTSNKEGTAYTGFFSPKRPAYQRPPYQANQFNQEVHTAPAPQRMPQSQPSNMTPSNSPHLSPGATVGMNMPPPASQFHFPAYLPQTGAGSSQASFGTGSNPMPPLRQQFRAPPDARGSQISPSQHTIAPPRTNLQRQAPPVGLPVVPPQNRMGSITSGYPVHKPPHVSPPAFPQQRPFFVPRGTPFPFPGHRFV